MITAILVDDDSRMCETLHRIISLYLPDVEIIGTSATVSEAMELIYEKKPDLAFLDVDLPGADGFHQIENLKNIHVAIIFVSGHADFAAEALAKGALDYIVKPLDPKRLVLAVDKFRATDEKYLLQKRLQELEKKLEPSRPHKNKIFLFDKDSYCIIDEEDIISLSSDGSYTSFEIVNRPPIVTSKNLGYYEKKLSKDRFMRIHKSHLISVDHAKGLTKSGDEVIMPNGKMLPIGKDYKAIFRALFEKND